MRGTSSARLNALYLTFGTVIAALILLCPALELSLGPAHQAYATAAERPAKARKDELASLHGRASALRPLPNQTVFTRSSSRAHDLASLEQKSGGLYPDHIDGTARPVDGKGAFYFYAHVSGALHLNSSQRIRAPPSI